MGACSGVCDAACGIYEGDTQQKSAHACEGRWRRSSTGDHAWEQSKAGEYSSCHGNKNTTSTWEWKGRGTLARHCPLNVRAPPSSKQAVLRLFVLLFLVRVVAVVQLLVGVLLLVVAVVLLEAQPLRVGHQPRAVVLLVSLAAARPQLVGAGLAVEDVNAVAAAQGALGAVEEFGAVLHVVLQRRQAWRVRLADPSRQPAADGRSVVTDASHSLQHLPLAHLYSRLPHLAQLMPAAVAVDEGQSRSVSSGQQRHQRLLARRRAVRVLAVDDGAAADEEVVQTHLAARAHGAVHACVLAQLRAPSQQVLGHRQQSSAGLVGSPIPVGVVFTVAGDVGGGGRNDGRDGNQGEGGRQKTCCWGRDAGADDVTREHPRLGKSLLREVSARWSRSQVDSGVATTASNINSVGFCKIKQLKGMWWRRVTSRRRGEMPVGKVAGPHVQWALTDWIPRHAACSPSLHRMQSVVEGGWGIERPAPSFPPHL